MEAVTGKASGYSNPLPRLKQSPYITGMVTRQKVSAGELP